MKNYKDATYNKVISVLKEFQEKYPRPGIPDLLKLIKQYKLNEFNQISQHWSDFVNPGVYFIFSDDDELLYIGMSTSIGSRVNSHFGSLINPKTPQWLQDEGKIAGYVAILLIDNNHRFEAPAIEDYVVCKLQEKL